MAALQDFLPDFANAENRALDAQVRAAHDALQQAELDVQDQADRAEVMADHLSRVQTELTHSQLRLASRREELAGEKHLEQLVKREHVSCLCWVQAGSLLHS